MVAQSEMESASGSRLEMLCDGQVVGAGTKDRKAVLLLFCAIYTSCKQRTCNAVYHSYVAGCFHCQIRYGSDRTSR